MTRPIAWTGSIALAVLATAAVGQVTRDPRIGPQPMPLTDAMRLSLLEQRVTSLSDKVTTLNGQVKDLQAKAARAVYMKMNDSDPTLVCTSNGTLSPNDILAAGRTYKAVIDKKQDEYALGYVMPVFTCRRN